MDLYVSNLTTRNPLTGRPMPLFPQVLCTQYSNGMCISWGADPSESRGRPPDWDQLKHRLCYLCSCPRAATYTWSSTEFLAQDYLSLPPGQVAAGTTLAIAVFNSMVYNPVVAQFDIVVSSNGTNMALQAGRQIFGYVTAVRALLKGTMCPRMQ